MRRGHPAHFEKGVATQANIDEAAIAEDGDVTLELVLVEGVESARRGVDRIEIAVFVALRLGLRDFPAVGYGFVVSTWRALFDAQSTPYIL
jgi:hypothetical protein